MPLWKKAITDVMVKANTATLVVDEHSAISERPKLTAFSNEAECEVRRTQRATARSSCWRYRPPYLSWYVSKEPCDVYSLFYKRRDG